LDISNKENISKVLKILNINNKNFFNGINERSIKDTLKEKTNDAFKKEVFGAPTFIVNDKIFWGQDRLEYAVEELNSN
jgi:2-hydroxychromene-2-carboxylate isomerase